MGRFGCDVGSLVVFNSNADSLDSYGALAKQNISKHGVSEINNSNSLKIKNCLVGNYRSEFGNSSTAFIDTVTHDMVDDKGAVINVDKEMITLLPDYHERKYVLASSRTPNVGQYIGYKRGNSRAPAKAKFFGELYYDYKSNILETFDSSPSYQILKDYARDIQNRQYAYVNDNYVKTKLKLMPLGYSVLFGLPMIGLATDDWWISYERYISPWGYASEAKAGSGKYKNRNNRYRARYLPYINESDGEKKGYYIEFPMDHPDIKTIFYKLQSASN